MSRRHFPFLFAIAVTTTLTGSGAHGAERRLIIGFRSAGAQTEEATVHASRGKLRKQYRHVRALVADVQDSDVAALKRNPAIAYVEDDVVVQAIAPVTYGATPLALAPVTGGVEYLNAWSVSHIGSQARHDLGFKGAGIRIAVLDTGIDYKHPDLSMNYAGGDNFISLDPNNHDPYDDSFNSHGTHVAGTIAATLDGVGVVGVAPDASLYAVKVLDGAGFGSLSSVIAGLDWAVANRMDIVNMSIGFSTFSQALADACATAEQAGLLLVAAAGNTYGGAVLFPAALPSVIAVGATTSLDVISPLSAHGPEVGLTAPGLNVYSTVADGGYGYLGGTSQAAPHATGVAALLMSAGVGDVDGNGVINNRDVRLQLQSTAIDLGAPGLDPEYGYGLVTASKPQDAGVPNQPQDAGLPNPPQDGGVQDPPTHLLIERLDCRHDDHENTAQRVTLSNGAFTVTIVNTSLSALDVAVFEAGEIRRDLFVRYRFSHRAPQEVSFVIDAKGATYELRFAPKGRAGSLADAYIQKQ